MDPIPARERKRRKNPQIDPLRVSQYFKKSISFSLILDSNNGR